MGLASALVGAPAQAQQDIVGFDRDSFGSVVLNRTQSAIPGIEFEAAFGDYNNDPISNYSETSIFAQMGRAVGRLDILTDSGTFPCTAFIVDDKHLLTNYHCVPGILENEAAKATTIEAVQFVAGYTKEGVAEGTRNYQVLATPVEANKTLDYAILKVIGNPSKDFGKLDLTAQAPNDGDPYWIIGHPQGEAQRISREECKANRPAVSNDRLLHTCDTLPGNSGSPVIDATLRMVVALHHAGSSNNSVNYAVPMGLILEQSNVLVASAGGSYNPTPNPDPIPDPKPDPKPDPETTDNSGGVCDALYAEAKAYNQCYAYKAYADQCASHTFIGFAKGYIADKCTIVQNPDPIPDPKPDPIPDNNYARPSWCYSGGLNTTESTICGDAYLASLDLQMDTAYANAGAYKVSAEQRSWRLNQRDRCGSNTSCIASAYNTRLTYLSQPQPKPAR